MKPKDLLKRMSLLGLAALILASCASEPTRKVIPKTNKQPTAKAIKVESTAVKESGKVKKVPMQTPAPVKPIKIKPKAVVAPQAEKTQPRPIAKQQRLYPTDSKFSTPAGPRKVATAVPTPPAPAKVAQRESSIVVNSQTQPESLATPEPVQTKMSVAASKPRTDTVEVVKVTLETLPITIANWTLDYDPQRMQNHCYLQSAKQKMQDGQSGSTVYAQVSATRIAFVTDSNIDTAYSDSGVQVDLNPRIGIESLYRETAIEYVQSADELLKQLLVGKTAVLTLGFWPTWPMTRSYTLEIDLSEFGRAFQALQLCDAML